MLFDDQQRLLDIDLLHDFGLMSVPMQRPAAAGEDLERVYREKGDLLGREGHPIVLGMTGLAADGAFAAIGIRGGSGLDDV